MGDANRMFSEWYYHSDLPTKQRWYGATGGMDSEYGWGAYLARLQMKLDLIHRVAADPSARVLDLMPQHNAHSGELNTIVIDAIANDCPGVFQVNVPNNGAIPGIADDVVVEGKALVDASGAKLLHVDLLPTKLLQYVIQPRVAKAEREPDAFATGDRDLLLGCLLVDDHRTASLEQAEDLLDALFALPWNRAFAERFGPRRRTLPAYPAYPLPGGHRRPVAPPGAADTAAAAPVGGAARAAAVPTAH